MANSARASIDARDVLGLLDGDERQTLLSEEGKTVEEVAAARSAQWLLAWLTRQRMPFVKMTAELCGVLERLEASIRGSIHFVVLPEHGAEIALDFGPQMRQSVATALRRATLAEDAARIEERLREMATALDALIAAMRPESVERQTRSGETFERMSEREVDPLKRQMYRQIARSGTYDEDEYHPDDARAMQRVRRDVAELGALLRRVTELLGSQPQQTHLPSALRKIDQRVAAKAVAMHDNQSREHPRARKSRDQALFAESERRIAACKEAVIAASDFAAAAGETFDFLSLAFRGDYARVYELWVLARLINALLARGAAVDNAARIADRTWSLKFTKDSEPALGFILAGTPLDLFYQYFAAGAARGSMPDLLLRVRGGKTLMVVDPKRGKTFTRAALAEVCRRYFEAFRPQSSSVANYFALGRDPVERLADEPACCILNGLQPDSPVAVAFEDEIDATLKAALGVTLPRLNLVVLFDISPSTANARPALARALQEALGAAVPAPATTSQLLLFADTIVAARPLDDARRGAVDLTQVAGGTNLEAAIAAALARLAALPTERALWIFTDVHGGELRAERDAIAAAGVTLRVWESAASDAPSRLQDLASAVGGTFVRIP